jgi:hypothetical protein
VCASAPILLEDRNKKRMEETMSCGLTKSGGAHVTVLHVVKSRQLKSREKKENKREDRAQMR